MSKAYKKEGDYVALRLLIESAQAAEVPKLESLVEELEAWLSKRSA